MVGYISVAMCKVLTGSAVKGLNVSLNVYTVYARFSFCRLSVQDILGLVRIVLVVPALLTLLVAKQSIVFGCVCPCVNVSKSVSKKYNPLSYKIV